jgi:hypothetical protein
MEFAFDSCQSRIIYAEKETAGTGQIKNCNGYIVRCLLKKYVMVTSFSFLEPAEIFNGYIVPHVWIVGSFPLLRYKQIT